RQLGEDRQSDRGRGKVSLSHLQQSGVPQGRSGGRGFHAARSGHPRRRIGARATSGERALRSFRADGKADHRHGHFVGGNDQVRGERYAGDQYLIHERDRQPLRQAGRQRRHGEKGNRQRYAARFLVLVFSTWLRGVVLVERRLL